MVQNRVKWYGLVLVALMRKAPLGPNRLVMLITAVTLRNKGSFCPYQCALKQKLLLILVFRVHSFFNFSNTKILRHEVKCCHKAIKLHFSKFLCSSRRTKEPLNLYDFQKLLSTFQLIPHITEA
jgi:hypothetical protein